MTEPNDERQAHLTTAEHTQLQSRVGTLLEALPYIRQFHGRTIVIKYGGSAMLDESLREGFATDVVLLKYVGLNPIVVHGGGPDITDYMNRLDMPVEFKDGFRVTNAETVEVVKMVLLGKVNADIVRRLNMHGQPAVGLSGDDGDLFQIVPHARAEEVGFIGDIEHVDAEVLNHVAADYIPVIASVGSDQFGNSYNINADTAAGRVAEAMQAHKVIFLTDVEGWLEDPDDPSSLIRRVNVERARELLEGVTGGMRPKLEACIDAIEGGVGSAHILDGRKPHSLLLELFTDAGIGTMMTAA